MTFSFSPSDSCPGSRYYCPVLPLRETALAVQFLKHRFTKILCKKLDLLPVVAPLFFAADSGLQDGLDGVMQPAEFSASRVPKGRLQFVHSLAKWKRLALKTYGVPPHQGVLADMTAIRKDDQLDATHSILVDQWDWEQRINPQDRNVAYLQNVVCKVYDALLEVERILCEKFPMLTPVFPPAITFLHSQHLADKWPELSPPDREQKAAEQYGAIFVRGIGADLKDGAPHGTRSWDYDDYTTEGADGLQGLNGDIIVLDPTSGKALELSSMGIRVDAAAMRCQAEAWGIAKTELNSPFHRGVLDGTLPSCIGGGIGQSRTAMLLLRKLHIGEVQCSVWPQETVDECNAVGCSLL